MTTKREAFAKLAGMHLGVDESVVRVVRIRAQGETDTDDQPVKLLEVSNKTVPVGILPLGFGPSKRHGVLFPSIIVDVTPDEYEGIRTRRTPLPHGWELDESEAFTQPAG